MTLAGAVAAAALLGVSMQPGDCRGGGSMGALSAAASTAEAAYERATQTQEFHEVKPLLPRGYWLSR